MLSLADVPAFPDDLRQLLEGQYGISSAEAFFEFSMRNPAGLKAAMGISPERIAELTALVAGRLPASFLKACQRPPVRRPRGARLD